MNKEKIWKEKTSVIKISKLQIIEEEIPYRKKNDAKNRKGHKKKTLKRIKLDCPDELVYSSNCDQIIKKPDEISRSISSQNLNSRSMISTPHRVLINNGSKNLSLSHNKLPNRAKKGEPKNGIADFKIKKLKFQEGNESHKEENNVHNINIKKLISDENNENKNEEGIKVNNNEANEKKKEEEINNIDDKLFAYNQGVNNKENNTIQKKENNGKEKINKIENLKDNSKAIIKELEKREEKNKLDKKKNR